MENEPVKRLEPGTPPISRRTVLAALAVLAWDGRALAQTAPGGANPAMPSTGAPAAGAGASAPDWPRVVKTGETTISFYLPQLDSWDGHRLAAHNAVSIQTSAKTQPVFGVASLSADTQVDKGARQVTLENLRIEKVHFPSAAGQEAAYQKLLERHIPSNFRTIELDRLETALAMSEARAKGESPPLKNDPPQIVFSTTPAILVLIDGAPTFRPVAGTPYERVVNTRPLILKDAFGTHYLRLFDGWMTAAAVTGPWSVARTVYADLEKVIQVVSKSGAVDLLTFVDPKDPKTRPTLAKGPVPAILVAMEPTELIVTQGEPNYEPIDGTLLLYASNTTGHVFKHLGDQRTYVLVTGRWFRADSLAGPWTFVSGADLPADFAKIPDESPKENVKASVPGTPQAQEAVIANSLPETAAIKVSEAKLATPKYDGPPQLKPIEGTPLSYVVNSPLPVIQVSPTGYYVLQNGVWFVGASLQGPWAVATTVPAVIYSIPPSAPLHYVTYVYVYRATPQVVYVGYTPGYYSVYVSNGVIVYGTGYYYDPWIGTVWYGTPVTYGFATSPTYSPWTGWVMGFGFGLAFGVATAGWGWGCYPWWGPYHGELRRGVRTVRRGRRVGSRRLGGDHRQHLPPLGRHDGRHPPLGRLQRLDGECLVGGRGDVLQLADWHRGGGAARRGQQRLHGELCLRRQGRRREPAHGAGGVRWTRDSWECLFRPIRLGRLRPRSVRRRRARGRRPLRQPRRQRLPQHRGRLAAEQRRRVGQRQ